MDKPKPKIKTYYDFRECKKYIIDKYCYEDEVINNFWMWIVKHHEISNPCSLYFSEDSLEDLDYDKNTPENIKRLYRHYLTEFADQGGELEMEVWW